MAIKKIAFSAALSTAMMIIMENDYFEAIKKKLKTKLASDGGHKDRKIIPTIRITRKREKPLVTQQ